jgi:hypothetical protein
VTLMAVTVLLTGPLAAGADNFAEFIGRSDQNGATITHYGYVTHAEGLADADLFFDPVVRTEATARITYFATTTLNARHQVGNIITTATAPGVMTVYQRASGGATFNDPASFAVGTAILSFALRYFNVLTVQGANQLGQPVGIASGTAFAEGSGLRLRFTASGQGTLIVNDPSNFVSVFLIGGHVVQEP